MNTNQNIGLLATLSDENLMHRVSNGHLDSLGILFERHHKHVYNYLVKMCGDRGLSEDITQEVFYKVMKYRASYKGGNFVSWIFSITRNALNSHFRKVKERPKDLESAKEEIVMSDHEKEEEFSQLHAALQKLSDTDRELLVLNRLQGIKYRELAEILESTPDAVKVKVNRAIKKLKKIYFENSVL